MLNLLQVYKRSKNPKYLATAQKLATYFLNNLPSDGIVPWCAPHCQLYSYPLIRVETGILTPLWCRLHGQRILLLLPSLPMVFCSWERLIRPIPTNGTMLLLMYVGRFMLLIPYDSMLRCSSSTRSPIWPGAPPGNRYSQMGQ